VQNEAYSQILS